MLTLQQSIERANRVAKPSNIFKYKDMDDGFLFFFGSAFFGILVNKATGEVKKTPIDNVGSFYEIPGISTPEKMPIG